MSSVISALERISSTALSGIYLFIAIESASGVIKIRGVLRLAAANFLEPLLDFLSDNRQLGISGGELQVLIVIFSA